MPGRPRTPIIIDESSTGLIYIVDGPKALVGREVQWRQHRVVAATPDLFDDEWEE